MMNELGVLLLGMFALGIAGSLHCAVMCGPLAMLARSSQGRSLYQTAFLYHAGRLATYAALGVLVGLLGEGLRLAALQRYTALAIGGGLLFAVVFRCARTWLVRTSSFFSALFSAQGHSFTLLSKCAGKHVRKPLVLGLLNGFVPCGLVYVAAAAAATYGNLARGPMLMLAFGLGTVPMLVASRSLGLRLSALLRGRRFVLKPIVMGLVGAALVMRSLGFGLHAGDVLKGIHNDTEAARLSGITCP